MKKAKHNNETEKKKDDEWSSQWKMELMLWVLPTILSCGLIAEKEPGCPMWGELPSMAE